MNNIRKKVRSNITRSSRGNFSGRVQNIDGIYNNANFMHAITSQIGNVVKVQTNAGAIFEGILKTFSSEFDVVLELAHQIDKDNPSSITVGTVREKMIFKSQDIVFMEFLDSEMDYATKDTFQTDTAISKFSGHVTEKELEPWDSSGSSIENIELESNSNGWDVNDMFKKNEQMYGVQSTFDQGLAGYTTQLKFNNSKDFKDAEAKASKIASEIEGNPSCKVRSDLENGDEEEQFAAVQRPVEEDHSNKYVCPPKRKTMPSPAKPVKSPPKVNESKPTSPPYYTVGHRGTIVRERSNGVSEPKPQRVPYIYKSSCSRNSERGTNGHGVQGNIEAKSSPPVNPVLASSGQPTPTTSSVQTIPIQTKPVKGREDTLNELKKFSSNFNLAEPTGENISEENSLPTEGEKRLLSDVPTVNPSRPSNAESPSSEKSSTPPKSKLNPNAKEFIFNPGAKAFSPRSCSTPTSSSTSRPNTPQTPNYGVQSLPTAMVVPTYVVASQPHYNSHQNPSNRYRRVHMGMHGRPEVASQMQVAAATGQPLLAPGPIPAQFTAVPYNSQNPIGNSPYPQMVRMVAQPGSGMMPIVQAINYPPDGSQHIPYMTQPNMGPHHPNIAVSPQPNNSGLGMNGNVATSGANNNNGHQPYIHHTPQNQSYSQTQGNPNSYPLMCPMIPAPPAPPPPPPQPGPYNPHHLISGVPSSVHLHHHHHHQSHNTVNSQQPHHIQVILPHSQ